MIVMEDVERHQGSFQMKNISFSIPDGYIWKNDSHAPFAGAVPDRTGKTGDRRHALPGTGKGNS